MNIASHFFCSLLCAAALAGLVAGASAQTPGSNGSGPSSPPRELVSALDNKDKEVEATVVQPCRDRRKALIAKERSEMSACEVCRRQLSQLDAVEKQQLARCDIVGIEARITDIEARKDATIQRLKTLLSQFQQQAQENMRLSEEIRQGESESEATFTEAAIGQMTGGLLDGLVDKQEAFIDAAEKRLSQVRAPNRMTRGELRALVAQMKAELAGKSKAEAQQIIAARLQRATLLVEEIRELNKAQEEVTGKLIDQVAGVKPDPVDDSLDQAYSTLTDILDEVVKKSGEKIGIIVHLNEYVLPLAPDTIKIGLVFANLHQLQQNVDGLARLTAAALAQREAAKAELDYLMSEKRRLVRERDQKQIDAKP